MGVPVISSDVGGQKELIDQAVGRIIPLEQDEEKDLDNRDFSEHEIAAYTDAIIALLQDREQYMQMKRACRERIEKQFSSDMMIHKLEHIFTQLVKDIFAQKMRQDKSNLICQLGDWADDYATAYQEIENQENIFQYQHTADTKSELMRIANSKWGQRLIKIAFKLKLNRIFR